MAETVTSIQPVTSSASTSSSQPPVQPIIPLTTSGSKSGHSTTLQTFPATLTAPSQQLHTVRAPATSHLSTFHQATLRETDKIDLYGTDLSPARSTTPTTSATTTTSATMPTKADHEDHEAQSITTFIGVLDLKSTSTPTLESGTIAKPSSGATSTTPTFNKQPRFLPTTPRPDLKYTNISRISPLNGQPTATSMTTPTTTDSTTHDSLATSLATPTTTDSTTHDSPATSITTPPDQRCTSTSTSSFSQSRCHSSTLTSSATTSATAATTPLPLDLNTTATHASTSDPLLFSPPTFHLCTPFHPGKLSRNQLPLNMKIEAIRLHEEEGLSGRSIMEVLNVHGFKCGKTQVQNILKRKHEWIEQYAQNAPLSRKRKLRKTGNEEINLKVYAWFEEALDRMVPVNGPMLQQKAVEIARELGIMEFKGSNGWLESFRKRHSISFGKVHVDGPGAGNKDADLQHRERQYFFDRVKSDLHGNDVKLSPTSEIPQMIVGEFVKKSASQRSSLNRVTEENITPTFPRIEKMVLKNEGNNWCKVAEEDVDKEEGDSEMERDDGEEIEREEDKTTDGEEEGVLSHPKFRSIQEVGAALREMRLFFATSNYSHLLDSCLDLEEQVALECITKREVEEKSTVLDHLNPLDTRPSSNAEQP